MTLQVTEQASAYLKTLLDNSEPQDDQIIRLVADAEGNSSLALDVEREGDQVVEHDGTPVMVVAPSISEGLSGAVLDLVETPDGDSLTLRSPA